MQALLVSLLDFYAWIVFWLAVFTPIRKPELLFELFATVPANAFISPKIASSVSAFIAACDLRSSLLLVGQHYATSGATKTPILNLSHC